MSILNSSARARATMLLGSGLGAMAFVIGASPAAAQDTPVAAPPVAAPPGASSTGQTPAPSAPQTAVPGATTPVAGLPSEPVVATNGTPEIVVTGVRASVRSALDLRKTATSLTESIVAEDIGKLPDNNVVESLQHVTGVSIVRNSVEPNVVLIRGLPDVTTTLNGRQIFTSSSRSISLPDLPAELLARVDVKKAATADDTEGGIAGVINVTLHRPFDFKKPQLAVSAKATYGSLIKKWSPQGSILLSDRWNTGIGEIGFLVNAAYVDRKARQDQLQNQNQPWLNFKPAANAGTGPAVGVPAGNIAYPGTVLLGQTITDIKRVTVSSSLQWRPSPTLDAYVDYFYAGLRQFGGTHVNVILLNTCPSATGNSAFAGTNIGQVLTSGCYGLTSMQARKSFEDTHQIAGGFNWNPTDRLTMTAQGNFTTSKNNTQSHIVDGQYNYGPQGVTVTVNPNNDGGYIINQPGDPQKDPTNNYVDQWYDFNTPQKGHEYAGRVDLNYKVSDSSFLRSLAVGYRYNSRSAIADSAGTGLNCASVIGAGIVGGSDPFNKYRQLALNSPFCTAYRAGSSPQPYKNQGSITRVGGISYASLGSGAYGSTLGSFFGGQYGTDGWVDLDPKWLFDNVETIRKGYGYTGLQDFIPSNHFDVTETANAIYGKLNYGIDFANGMTLDGNVGLRVVKTKLTEGGYTSVYVPLDPTVGPGVGKNATCITCLVYTQKVGERSDTQWLPSVNARLKLLTGLFGRASYSKTVTRPTFAQLNPGETVNAATATVRGSVTSGNANLTPIKSTNYDADLTYYWGPANHIGLSIFYRQVNGYIQTVATPITIDGLDYTRNRPENYVNATIKGIEGGYSQFLDFLPGALSGFGWDVNATYIEAPFNNVPKFHANLTGIYEKGPVSFRLSYTYNSPYRVGDFARGVQPQDRWSSIRRNMDASLNYRFSERLNVSLDATNLLNSRQREHAGQGSLNEMLYPTILSAYDRTIALGVRVKM